MNTKHNSSSIDNKRQLSSWIAYFGCSLRLGIQHGRNRNLSRYCTRHQHSCTYYYSRCRKFPLDSLQNIAQYHRAKLTSTSLGLRQFKEPCAMMYRKGAGKLNSSEHLILAREHVHIIHLETQQSGCAITMLVTHLNTVLVQSVSKIPLHDTYYSRNWHRWNHPGKCKLRWHGYRRHRSYKYMYFRS